mgnify:CR=1 FL=1
MKNLINIRVLQHDTNDQIRIGMAYPIIDLDKAEKDIVDNYEKKTAWCGGFKAAWCLQRSKPFCGEIRMESRQHQCRFRNGERRAYLAVILQLLVRGNHLHGPQVNRAQRNAVLLRRFHVPKKERIKDGFPNGATYKLIVPINVCISQ